jgi:hypothetical protein
MSGAPGKVLDALAEGDWLPVLRGPPMVAAVPWPKRETPPGERGFLARRPKGRGAGDGRLLAS